MNHFQKYMLKKNIGGQKQKVQLQLSESQQELDKKKEKNQKLRQLKIDDLFNNRLKSRDQGGSSVNKIPADNSPQKLEANVEGRTGTKNEAKYSESKNKFSEASKQLEGKINKYNLQKQPSHDKKSERFQKQEEAPIYQSITTNQFYQQRVKKAQQQRRMKKQLKIEEEKKKQQELIQKKRMTFRGFLSSFSQKPDKQQKKEQAKTVQLNNISMFNKMEDQNAQKMIEEKRVSQNLKGSSNLVYKNLTMERQKIPYSFLKLLLQYKFSSQATVLESKKVPNSFEDQMTYKKTFHYLVVNECIADLQQRLKKLQQKNGENPIRVALSNFKTTLDGLAQFSMNEFEKDDPNKNKNRGGGAGEKNEKHQKQKFALKNYTLSRNRLGILTNAKNFSLQHFGIPSPKNDRIFSFLCLLVTPESKQQLDRDPKGLCSIEINNLDLIFSANKTNKCYFYDLDKISTHLREYLSITNLYQTELASYVYKPNLIENQHLKMIHQEQRAQLQPILNVLKSQYNNTQYQSIRQMVLRDEGIVLLQGPPGTGKTTTLMGLLAAQYEYLKSICSVQEKRKILICAPSNAAIDHITKRLVREGLVKSFDNINFSRTIEGEGEQCEEQIVERIYPNILRVGIIDTDDPDIISVSLSQKCDQQMISVRDKLKKRNSMTQIQIKQKIFNIGKEINKLKSRNDLKEWDRDQRIKNFKYEIKRYESLLFYFRKQRIQLKQTYNQIENQLFQDADIILTTLSSSGSDKMDKVRGFIGCLIVDQAAQSTQPNVLIPFQTGARKVLLIGDPYQLPSTTMSKDSSITLFNRSLFQRFLDNGVKPYFLNIQYRMAPLIRQFPSQLFYNNRLIDAQSVSERYKDLDRKALKEEGNSENMLSISEFFNRNSIFLDVKFGQEQMKNDSFRNTAECLTIKSLILYFIKNTKLSIGVITPYQAQRKFLIKQLKKQLSSSPEILKQINKYVSFIRNEKLGQNEDGDEDLPINQGDHGQSKSLGEAEEGEIQNENSYSSVQIKQKKDGPGPYEAELARKNIDKMGSKGNLGSKQNKKQKSLDELLFLRVMINTVDSFQGQEKDIIIFSTVRSNARKDIGFLKDQRRINVALTRSRHLLIVAGNADTIGSNEIWNQYLDFMEQKRALYQIKDRQDIGYILGEIKRGPNMKRVQRKRHQKFSKDIRKQQRQEIRKQDFKSTGAEGRKKVKLDKSIVKAEESSKTVKQVDNLFEQKVYLQRKEDNQEGDIEKILQEKRAREQEALRFQEANRKIRELQEKLKKQDGSLYSKLFL